MSLNSPYSRKIGLLSILFCIVTSSNIKAQSNSPCGAGIEDKPYGNCAGGYYDGNGRWQCPSQEDCNCLTDPNCICIDRLHAVDPNDIIGSLGYDTVQWVSVNDRLLYTIRFEYDPKFATGPAQNVLIDLNFHENANPSSFKLESFGFGEYFFDVPNTPSFYSNQLQETQDSLGVVVNFTGGLDIIDKKAFWVFRSIDPTTGLPPTDAAKGFLPVNDSTVTAYTDTIAQKGEGFVIFSMKPNPNTNTMDTLLAQASIVFDDNAPIETNIWSNIIDAFPPTSSVNDLPQSVDSTAFISWNGSDDSNGVGIRDFALYVSKDGMPFYEYGTSLKLDSIIEFVGEIGSAYEFYTLATDFVGNRELSKAEGDAGTYFGSSQCKADFNQDGAVTTIDLVIFLADFGCKPPLPCVADLNDDNAVNISDLTMFLAAYGNVCSQ